jgi:hypothetical protein
MSFSQNQEGEATMTEDTGHWKSESGGAVSYAKILEKSFHELVLEQFGEWGGFGGE